MQRLEAPYKFFTDATGKPLDAGYVYFGVAGQSPDTSPITVYWDAAGTIPAAQPLRTAGGFIVRNGAPANVYANGNYSQLVKDKNGAQVFVDLSRVGNPDNYLTGITGTQVTAALGYTPTPNSFSEITGGLQVTMANPNTFDMNSQYTLTVYNTSTNPSSGALMQFLKPSYGLKMGIDANSTFALGGFSQGNGVYRWSSDSAGNFIALGNVTAYSDLRRKADIQPIQGALARTLQMRGFTYLDTVTGQRKIGVGAQEVQRAGFGEAVVSDEAGHLSVAYGQLSLPLLIECVRELHARVASLETQLQQRKEF